MTAKDVKEIFDRGLFRGEIRFDEPMSAHTSLKTGGPVEIMVFPEDPLSLKNVLSACEREDIPSFVIGAGTNLLAGDAGAGGVAISLREFRSIEPTRDEGVLFVGAGTPLAMLLGFAQRNGYAGLEALAGIPGSAGGAVYMNAGSFGTEMKDIVVSVSVMNRHGDMEILDRDSLGFAYRRSNLPEGSVILSVNIALGRDDPDAIRRRTREFLEKKRAAQPLGEASAGCVFRNPPGDSAGRLIDAAGCRGMRAGGAEVSRVHANFFINKGNATCRDFMQLMQAVKARVMEHSGVELEPEIKVVGGND